MPAPLVKHRLSDDRLLVEGAQTILTMSGTPAYLDATATVQATLSDWASGNAIVGADWPLSLAYITGSQGDFHGTLSDALAVTAGQMLRLTLVLDNGTNQRRTLSLRCQVQEDRYP